MIEIALANVKGGIGELELPDDQPRTWKLLLQDPESGITVSLMCDQDFVELLHEQTKVDGTKIVAAPRPKLVIPRSKL